MDALVLLRDLAARSDDLMTQTFAAVTVEQAAWRQEGSTANPIAAIFLHVYYPEDWFVHRDTGAPLIFEAGGWANRLGYDPAAAWSPSARPEPDACRAYAAEVRAATHDYLEHLDPSRLEEEIDSTRGKRSRVAMLSRLLVTHKLTHLGEIAALLGCQGVKGFPF
jgi:uncharacterized damage-inducible protein DinB